MQTTDVIEVNIDLALVRLSLRRSELRMKILRHLNEHGSSYQSEIAREILSDSSNVKGALEGMGVRYAEYKSLVGLGLVDKTGNIYRITGLGQQVLAGARKKQIEITF